LREQIAGKIPAFRMPGTHFFDENSIRLTFSLNLNNMRIRLAACSAFP
jgi:hypothetical protein